MSRLGLGSTLFVVLAACTGPDGPPGAKGDDVTGDPGAEGEPGAAYAPTLSTISPKHAYLGRDLDVLISGSGTRWTDAEALQIDLGPGVTVDPDSVVLASETAVALHVTIATDAEPGLRDVRITQGDTVAELAGMFAIDPSLVLLPQVVTNPNDPVAVFAHALQGAIIPSVVAQTDLETPFDFSPENVLLTFGGSSIHPQSSDLYQAAVDIELDVSAEPGGARIIADSGPPGAVIRSASGLPALEIIQRSPLSLETGHNGASLPSPDGSLLFKIDLPQEGLWTFTVSGAQGDAKLALLPGNGKFAGARQRREVHAFRPKTRLFARSGPAPMYLVFSGYSSAPSSGYAFDIDVSRVDFSQITPLAAPEVLGSIDVAGESDWYAFAGVAGQRVTLTTGPADSCGPAGPLDTELQVVNQAGAPLAENVDIGTKSWCSRVTVDIPTDGTYYARVASSQQYEPDGTFAYALSYEVE